MSLRGVIQCRKITLYYCDAWNDAAGIKEFARSLLPIFKRENPAVEIEIVTRPNQVAHVAAEYANGRGKKICVKRNNAEEIFRHVSNLGSCSGQKMDRTNRIKSYVEHVHRKSVQGPWSVWTFPKIGGGGKGPADARGLAASQKQGTGAAAGRGAGASPGSGAAGAAAAAAAEARG